MFSQLKNKLDNGLSLFIENIDKRFHLNQISPVIYDHIREYVLRDGKRIRPILFIIGYKSFSKRNPTNLYSSALAIELLHDFLLIHDDIIDKSATRRGKPAMHTMLNGYLKKYPKAKFSGEDLAIVIGDIMYAAAIESFLLVKEDPTRKERALRKFVEAACYTGCGEFIDTLSGAKDISDISIDDIYAVYDYKTAYYTFSCPITSGAILGGAKEKDVKLLHQFGIYLGRAFQIKDDILGVFAEEKITGKSSTTDLEENKKTLLLWHAYQNSSTTNKKYFKNTLKKEKISRSDLLKIRQIMIETGSLAYAKTQITTLLQQAIESLNKTSIKTKYLKILSNYSKDILKT
jgi:geranylgeranyl diphosphate synthase type I